MKIVILKNGQIVDSRKYDWNSETKTFSSEENGLVLDFGSLENVTIKVRNSCTIKCGWNCTINSGDSCTINSGDYCTINSGSFCTINSGNSCTIKCGWNCTINSGSFCTINSGNYCTINSGDYCTINSGDSCTINCGNYCTINSGDSCTIRTYWNTIIFPGRNCSIHYCYQEFNTLEHLIESEFQQILKTGELIKLKEIEYKEILFKENVFTYLLKENRKFNFYIDDKFNLELISAINSDNHSKLLMLQNENNTEFIKHFIKTFKKVN